MLGNLQSISVPLVLRWHTVTACWQVRTARHADMGELAAAHAADTSSEWTFEDLLRGEASPEAAAAAKLLAAAAAGQFPRAPGSGLQVPPMPARTLPADQELARSPMPPCYVCTLLPNS